LISDALLFPAHEQIEKAYFLGAACVEEAGKAVRRRMIWNRRADFVAESSVSSGSGYAARL
jgi:hypothetical protein